MKSIISYPERGNYGDSSYRGNCSGKVIKDLIQFFKPKTFFDPMVGGGSSIDVCKELGINHLGLDLNPAYGGFDVLEDDIPISSDFIFFHPPYFNIIEYSNNMWGKEPHPNDLSQINDYEVFIKKLDEVQAKLITSLRQGGRLAVLVGDVKKNGRLYSLQKDMTWFAKPEYTLIKKQHNVKSDSKDYGGSFIPISHEYIIIMKKDKMFVIPCKVTKTFNKDIRNSKKVIWRDVVLAALENLEGKAKLKQIYKLIAGHKKTENNNNWRAKIRQTLQSYNDFKRIKRGFYKLNDLNTKVQYPA